MALNPADIATLSRLLDEGLALPASERGAWLAALPPEHQRHAEALRGMLNDEAGLDTDPRLRAMPRLAIDEAVAHAGDSVGPYRLLHEIGRGGMGSVWLAERADGAFKRQVALKLPRLAWGAGLAERMAREREIGALLEHPAIARMYDAGVDERGRPYLALEYIDGQPIDAWCEAQGLGVNERLRLFVQVARAVAYAHGRLVVHRDLKPSNVLVTADGQAHLLDFGIAKLLQEAGAEDSGVTQQLGRVLTPHYASPEQIAGETITVASDVYGLGILLYELLTGRTPHATEGRSVAAVERAICEDAPALASSTVDPAIRRQLRGELDAILGKALKLEPNQRYSSVDAFADDVGRYLAGERVSAQPDSWGYRMRTVLRRHRLVFMAAGAVFVAIALGTSIALVQAYRASKAAERENMVKAFVAEIFRVNSRNDSSIAQTRRLSADDQLAAVALLIEKRFPDQPELQGELFGVVVGIFSEMGAFALAADYSKKQLSAMTAQGSTGKGKSAVLQRWANALLNTERLAQAEELAGAALQAADDAQARQQAHVLLARIRARRGDIAGSDAAAAQAKTSSSAQPVTVSDAWLAQLSADAAWRANQTELALAEYQRAVDICVQAEGPASRPAAEMRMELAVRFAWNNRLEEGQVQFQLAQSALRESGTAGAVRAAVMQARWWRTLNEMGQAAQSESVLAIGASRRAMEATLMAIPEVLRAEVDFAEGAVLSAAGSLDLAEPLIQNAAPVLRAATESPEKLAEIVYVEIDLFKHSGQHEKARVAIEEYRRLRKLQGLDKTPYGAVDYYHLVVNDLMMGNFVRARQTLDAAPKFEALKSDPVSGFIYAELLPWQRARLEFLEGHHEVALAQVGRLRDDEDKTYWHPTHALRAEIYCANHRSAEGLAIFRDVIDARQARTGPSDPALARHRAVAGLCALNVGNRKTALQMALAARSAFDRQSRVSAYFRAPLETLEKRLGVLPGRG